VGRLVEEIGRQQGSVAIIGVRQVSTVEGLRRYAHGKVRVIYVDASIENCAQRYAARDGRPLEAYDAIARHDVEQDQIPLKELADEVLDNNGSLEALDALVDRSIHAWSSES
jgi:dephospho-CoA kinase